MQCKVQKEGTESEQFWDFLGGKSEYPSQKIGRDAETDPHLFSCSFSKGKMNMFIGYVHLNDLKIIVNCTN